MNPFVKNEEGLWAKSLTGSSPSSERFSQSRNSKDIWQRGNQGRPVKRRKRKLVEAGEEYVPGAATGNGRRKRGGGRREGKHLSRDECHPY